MATGGKAGRSIVAPAHGPQGAGGRGIRDVPMPLGTPQNPLSFTRPNVDSMYSKAGPFAEAGTGLPVASWTSIVDP